MQGPFNNNFIVSAISFISFSNQWSTCSNTVYMQFAKFLQVIFMRFAYEIGIEIPAFWRLRYN